MKKDLRTRETLGQEKLGAELMLMVTEIMEAIGKLQEDLTLDDGTVVAEIDTCKLKGIFAGYNRLEARMLSEEFKSNIMS